MKTELSGEAEVEFCDGRLSKSISTEELKNLSVGKEFIETDGKGSRHKEIIVSNDFGFIVTLEEDREMIVRRVYEIVEVYKKPNLKQIRDYNKKVYKRNYREYEWRKAQLRRLGR